MPRSRRKGGAVKTREIEIQQRRKEAIELRKAGATYESIGERLGVSTTTAYTYVREALHNMVAEPTEELRRMHYERLNHLLITLWPKAVKGDMPSLDRAVGVMDRIAKLYGVDAPQPTMAVDGREVIIIDGSKGDYIESLKKLRKGSPENFNGGGAVSRVPSDAPQNIAEGFEEPPYTDAGENLEIVDVDGEEE